MGILGEARHKNGVEKGFWYSGDTVFVYLTDYMGISGINL